MNTSFGHFNAAPPDRVNGLTVSQTARPDASATSGHRWLSMTYRRGSRINEKASDPGADHHEFEPRPRPAVCLAAMIRYGHSSEPSRASCAARSLVEPISG